MTTRNKRKLAALNKKNCEENPRSNLAQNSGAPRSQEDYITQVSEDIEGRVTKRLSKEFSRTENRILVALARLDDFLMNPLLPGHSGTTPETTRNTSHNNQGTNEDGSQRMILILKRVSSMARQHETLAKKMATTPSKQNCAETNSFHHLPSTTKTPMHAAPESVPVASQHWNHRNVHEMLIKKKQEIRHQSAVSTVGIFEFSPGTAISSQIKQCTETSECCV